MMEPRKIHVEDSAGNSYDLIDVEGVMFPVYFADDPVQRLKDVKSMQGRDDDVLICAYPKAGTHWVWEITNMLLRGSAEYHPSVKEAQMMELKGSSGADQLTSPRVFNTHLRFRQLPTDMINRKCKIIYITRNPKDMAVSRFFHNSKGSVGYKGTFSNYLPLYMEGKVAFGSWFDYTAEWERDIREHNDYPVHSICYETLKTDTENEVQRLGDFLGVKSDPTLIQEICDKCSFNNLKESYSKTKQVFQDLDHPPEAFAFRKGEVGDWKNWFTVAQSEQFDAKIRETLPDLINTFVYE